MRNFEMFKFISLIHNFYFFPSNFERPSVYFIHSRDPSFSQDKYSFKIAKMGFKNLKSLKAFSYFFKTNARLPKCKQCFNLGNQQEPVRATVHATWTDPPVKKATHEHKVFTTKRTDPPVLIPDNEKPQEKRNYELINEITGYLGFGQITTVVDIPGN